MIILWNKKFIEVWVLAKTRALLALNYYVVHITFIATTTHVTGVYYLPF